MWAMKAMAVAEATVFSQSLARRHKQVAKARQLGRDILDEPVGQPVQVRIAPHRAEGRNNDRTTVGKCQRQLVRRDIERKAQAPARQGDNGLCTKDTAKIGDLHVQIVLTHNRIGPDRRHDLIAADDPVPVHDQQFQKIELPRSERHDLDAATKLPRPGVESCPPSNDLEQVA